jgi:hypothetical protein
LGGRIKSENSQFYHLILISSHIGVLSHLIGKKTLVAGRDVEFVLADFFKKDEERASPKYREIVTS